jgi:hypothetical protein
MTPRALTAHKQGTPFVGGQADSLGHQTIARRGIALT